MNAPATQQDMDTLLRQFGVSGSTQDASGSILSGAQIEVTPMSPETDLSGGNMQVHTIDATNPPTTDTPAAQ